MARFFKAWKSHYDRYEDEKGHGSDGHKGSGSRGSRGSDGHKGSGSRGSRGSKGSGSHGSKGSGSRGSRGSKGSGSRGSKGSGSKGSGGSGGGDCDTDGPDIAKLKFFYSTVNEDGTTSELSPEGNFQFVEVRLEEGTSFDDIPLEEAEQMVLDDLEEGGVKVGDIYQVTVVIGSPEEGDEQFFDYTLEEDEHGELSLVPIDEDDDFLAQFSTGDCEDEHFAEEEEEEEDDHPHYC